MKSPTKVIFLWHMHQPLYKYPGQKDYGPGWVRLHAVKDYYGMAAVLDKFKHIKAAVNFSGVLLSQLYDYTQGAKDEYLKLTLKKPRYLSKEEKSAVTEKFFYIHFDRYIRPHKRYLQLHQKKISGKKFTDQDILDLQTIFNLCWFHPYSIKKDKNLGELVKKKKDYTADDKQYVIDAQYSIISRIFPLYRKLNKAGRIEMTVTPFYHPIMPLLYDTDVVNEFSYLKTPASRFRHPEDCRWHLEKSKEIFRTVFHNEVRGSWPSEGSISEGVAEIYCQKDFDWIGLDEGILFRSLMKENVSYELISKQRHLIYQAYDFHGLKMMFRDRNLSDALSFTYQGWDPGFAAQDLMQHFKRIHYHAKSFLPERMIPIIMDGENAWEYYQNSGVDFFENLYKLIEKSEIISTATPSEFFKASRPRRLERLAPGSWINSDFGVWVGSRTNNQNWHTLKQLRDLIEKNRTKAKDIDKIMNYFYIIEGSDWNWWNTYSESTGDFHRLFFAYVKEIYRLLGKTPPAYIK